MPSQATDIAIQLFTFDSIQGSLANANYTQEWLISRVLKAAEIFEAALNESQNRYARVALAVFARAAAPYIQGDDDSILENIVNRSFAAAATFYDVIGEEEKNARVHASSFAYVVGPMIFALDENVTRVIALKTLERSSSFLGKLMGVESAEPVAESVGADIPTEELKLPPALTEALIAAGHTSSSRIAKANSDGTLTDVKGVGEGVRAKIMKAIEAAQSLASSPDTNGSVPPAGESAQAASEVPPAGSEPSAAQ